MFFKGEYEKKKKNPKTQKTKETNKKTTKTVLTWVIQRCGKKQKILCLAIFRCDRKSPAVSNMKGVLLFFFFFVLLPVSFTHL